MIFDQCVSVHHVCRALRFGKFVSLSRPVKREVKASAMCAWTSAALLLASCGSSTPVVASSGENDVAPLTSPNGRLRSVRRAGDALSIRTGFIPDPVVVRGETHADTPLAFLGENCLGLGSEAPTQRIQLDTRFGFLRLFATGPEDLTLAVRTQDGAILCSDDRFGLHPSIEGRFPPGVLEVWIGVKPPEESEPVEGETPLPTPEPEVNADADAGPVVDTSHLFELELTETRSVRPGVRMGEEQDHLTLAMELGLDVEAETGQSNIRLRRGFLPDPRTLEGAIAPTTEGLDVSGLEASCGGVVVTAPSHVITLQEDFDYFQVYVADAPEDTVLIVLGPDGSLVCDSSDEDQPQVENAIWPAGVYRIWVGAQRADAAFPYQLGVSEIRRAR